MGIKKQQTIVIEYEGDEPPLKGFGVPVLGCEVTAIAMGDELEKSSAMRQKLEAIPDKVLVMLDLFPKRLDELISGEI